jgi:hypothetical protein
VQENNDWQLLHIGRNEAVLDGILDFKWLREPLSSRGGLAIVETQEGYGIISSAGGMLAPPIYDDIQNLGTPDAPLFYLERRYRDQGFYDITYLNQWGKPIFENRYTQAEWEMLLCD